MKIKRFSAFMLITVLIGSMLPTISHEHVARAQASEAERITVEELKAMLARQAPVAVLDVRAGASYDDATMKIKGALRIPPDEVEARLKEIPRNSEVVTYCT